MEESFWSRVERCNISKQWTENVSSLNQSSKLNEMSERGRELYLAELLISVLLFIGVCGLLV